MPKRANNHERDKVATRVLKQIFPDEWIFKSPRDVDSGREYSEDWIVEIIETANGEKIVSSIEFGVQNKTNPDLSKRYATVTLTKADILRLISLARPVMLHAFDIDTKTSYWLWLDDWYVQNELPEGDDSQKVRVRIPLESQLNIESLKAVEHHARWYFERRQAENRAYLTNRKYPEDYDIQISTTDYVITTIVNPKRPTAVPKFVALEEHAHAALAHLEQTGEPVFVDSGFKIEGLPETLAVNDSAASTAILLPNIPDQILPVKIEFIGKRGKRHLVLHRVHLRLVQSGSRVKRYVGASSSSFLTFELLNDSRAEKNVQTRVQFSSEAMDHRTIQSYLTVMESLHGATEMRWTFPTWEHTIAFSLDDKLANLMNKVSRLRLRLIKAIVVIEDALHIEITIPREVSNKDLRRAEIGAKIIKDGGYPIPYGELPLPEDAVLICGDPVSNARDLLRKYEETGHVDVLLVKAQTELTLQLFDQSISFGKVSYGFPNCRILNLEEVRQAISVADSEEIIVNTVFEIDRDRALYHLTHLPLPPAAK